MANAFRYIDPNIRKSESVSKLTYRQRDLWTRLLLTVDDQGRCLANPALIRSEVWPLEDISIADVQEDIDSLVSNGFVLVYEVGEKKYLQVIKWHEYQRHAEWLGRSLFPAPKGWEDRYRYHSKNKEIEKSNNWSTYSLGRPTGSGLPVNDVNNDVNNDKDVNEDDDINGGATTSPLQRRIEQLTGVMPTNAADVKALDEIEKIDPDDSDIIGAINWLKDQNVTVYHYKTLVRPIGVQKAMRTQKEIPKNTAYERNKAAFAEILGENYGES